MTGPDIRARRDAALHESHALRAQARTTATPARPDDQPVTTITVQVSCPQCAGPITTPTPDPNRRPGGPIGRHRAAPITCHHGPNCWTGVIAITLEDHHLPADLPRSAR